jgi:hypothetical protein
VGDRNLKGYFGKFLSSCISTKTILVDASSSGLKLD